MTLLGGKMRVILKQIKRIYKVGIVLSDLIIINIAYIIAFLIKFNFELPSFNFTPYLEAMPFITIAALIYLDLFGMLKFFRRSYSDIFASIIYVVFLLALTTTSITYFNQRFSFPRTVLISAPIIQVILLGLWKGAIVFIKNHFAPLSRLMVIIGDTGSESTLNKIKKVAKNYSMDIKCVYRSEEIDNIEKSINHIDEVFICSEVSDDKKMEIISHCTGSRKIFYIIPQLFEISLLNSRIIQFDDIPAFVIDRLGLSVEQRFFKRIFDIVIAFVLLALSLPLIIVSILAIKLTTKGKAFYVQKRNTEKNRVYRIYKLRTMNKDAEQDSGPIISGRNDPRVTIVGKVLRKFHIDEIPQLFNVIKGDMSLVGPRAERECFITQYEKEIPHYNHRSFVKAGVTGFAQILGNYDTSPEDKLRYDLLYIKNYSILLDIKLIIKTIKVILTGKNLSQKNFYKNLGVYKNEINI
jgi:exopolysaccharide biosynthesis polyprenyl glycosylphosphotransferase